jgi:hypothetical protein
VRPEVAAGMLTDTPKAAMAGRHVAERDQCAKQRVTSQPGDLNFVTQFKIGINIGTTVRGCQAVVYGASRRYRRRNPKHGSCDGLGGSSWLVAGTVILADLFLLPSVTEGR